MSLSTLDKRHVWHPFTQMEGWLADAPLIIERGEGCYLIDTDGKRYLDGVSSLWVNVHGHNHPVINQAIRAQLDSIAHTTLLGLASPASIGLAAKLASLAPAGLERVFYSDSGSTAVEIALKLSFQFWQHVGHPTKRRFLHLQDAYHGDTLGAVGVGGIELFHQLFGPLIVTSLEAPNPARVGLDEAQRALRELFERHAGELAGFIVEPLVQGAAGMLMHSPEYLQAARELCTDHDVLLIADEVATGFGRTGTMFACEQANVAPDLLCLAKGVTGGYLPLAATMATDRIYEAFLGEGRTFFHGHTYTGNPLACAAALASLELFEQESTLEHARARAQQLGQLLETRLQCRPEVLEVRQRGLMVGLELTGNALEVCARIREHGVILRPLGEVVVLMPPLAISSAELEILIDALVVTLDEIFS